GRVAPSRTFVRTSGRWRAPRTASYCARVTVRSMNSLAKPRVGGKSSAGAPFSQGTRMPRTEFIATGFHVPERVVTNDDLSAIMDTSDEWITPRSGIKTRHWVSEGETGVTLARRASLQALAKAGMKASELDCIVYCTCTPDHFEPGNGVFLQRELGISDIPAIDVRNQCSGFVYGLSVADAWIRVGQYRRVLLVGAEVHSRGLDRTTRGRDTAVLFGDGAGVATIGLRDDQVYVNIQKYGNTTAASIPIALHEALCEGRLKRGDLLIMTAFGSGFTWASAAIRWRLPDLLSPEIAVDDRSLAQRLDARLDLTLVAHHHDVEVVRVDVLP